MMEALVGLLRETETEALWKKVPAFKLAVEELEELIQDITAASRAQDARRGPAADKARALQLLGDEAHAVAAATHACAVASGNEALALRTDLSRTNVTKGRDAAILERCKEIHSAAAELVDSLADYDVTSTDLNSLKRRIDAFEALRSKPRERIATSSAATKRLGKLFRQANTLLWRRLDRLAVKLKASQPKFYEDYRATRVVVGNSGRASQDAKVVTPVNTAGTPPLAKAA
jgi:hypothetical protein